jgi:predicted alpha/beta superfamily hydrolase
MKRLSESVALVLLMLTLSLAQEVAVTINVIPPRSTPANSPLFIAGNDSVLGNWRPDGVQMRKKSDSLWTIDLKFPKDYLLEFKITRGSWNTEAIYTQNELPPNVRIALTKDTAMTLRPISWRDSGFVFGGGIVGTVKYHRNLRGEGLDYARDVIVWLPPSYATDTTKRYPVLYMHDGQNVFDPTTSFIGYDWHVDEVVDSLIRDGKMREIIVVGIYNSPDRILEYAYNANGEAYIRFIVDRENTATMGSSMGGEISFLMVWDRPDVFSKAGCLSSVFPDGLIDKVKRSSGMNHHVSFYIDNGGVGDERRLLRGGETMVRVLKEKGFVEGKNLQWFYDENGDHSERAWAKRVWRPLTFMFGR